MTRSKTFLATIGAAGLALGALSASAAAEEREFGWYVTLTGASDYMFRGISYTDENPTVNAYVEGTYGIAYLATWITNIDSGDYEPWEQDWYAGIRPVTGPISWDIAAWYYTYPAAKDASSLDYWEFRVGATATPITNLSVGVAGYWTPDQSSYAETNSVEGTIGYTLPAFGIFTPTVSGLYGWSGQTDSLASGTDFTGFAVEDYTYWNAGVKLAVEKFTFDFRYWDTSINDGLADERVVFSASITLP